MLQHNISNLKKVHNKVTQYQCLEILFTIVKNNKDIKSLKILGNTFIYTTYANDTTFFLKKLGSIKDLLKTVCFFLSSSGLKPNLSKSKEATTGLIKGVKVSVCRIKCIDLTKDAKKILGICFRIIKILN